MEVSSILPIMSNLTLLFLFILLDRNPTAEREFKIMTFGGNGKYHSSVFIHDVNVKAHICQLSDLPQYARLRPYASILNGNLTICGGELNDCFQYQSESWLAGQSFYRGLAGSTTTFDNHVWTMLGGWRYFNEYKLAVLTPGQGNFVSIGTGHRLGKGSCTVRFNQTHAIDSKGSERVLWYQEEGHTLTEWEKGEVSLLFAACGLTLGRDNSYKFVIASGQDGNTELATNEVLVYSFSDGLWSEGARLSRKLAGASHVQYQNSFLLLGGAEPDGNLSPVFKYDIQEGWIQMPMELGEGNSYFGSFHLEHPSIVGCP